MMKTWNGLCNEAPRFAVTVWRFSVPYVVADISNLFASAAANRKNVNGQMQQTRSNNRCRNLATNNRKSSQLLRRLFTNRSNNVAPHHKKQFSFCIARL